MVSFGTVVDSVRWQFLFKNWTFEACTGWELGITVTICLKIFKYFTVISLECLSPTKQLKYKLGPAPTISVRFLF